MGSREEIVKIEEEKALYNIQEICTHHLRILQKSELWAGMHSLSQEG